MSVGNDLRTVPSDLFDRTWKIVQECGEQERHFNQLQSVYRGLASTWILATFGGVGYLLFNKDILGGDLYAWRPAIAAIICALGAFGVGLLWNLDLHVYQRLLVAVFEQGRMLECEFSFLPRIRTKMLEFTGGKVRNMIAMYYLLTAGVPLALAAIFLIWQATRCRLPLSADALIAFASLLVVRILLVWMLKRTTTKIGT